MNLEQLIALGLDEDKAKEALALHEEDVGGLKTKNTELLGKFEGYKTDLSTKDQAIEDARQVAIAAEEAKLLAEGKYEEAQKLREQEGAELVAKANQAAEKAQNALKQRDFSEVRSEIMQRVYDDPIKKIAAESLIEKNLNISYAEDGTKNTSLMLGDKEFKDTKSFLEAANTDSTWSGILSAPNTQGVGAEGNKGGQAAAVSNNAAEAAKKTGDQVGHLNALFAQNLKGNS